MTEFLYPNVSISELGNVLKPAQYSGGEPGSCVKQRAEVEVCLAFPDLYEIGMSHLGLQILYSLINRLSWASAQRVFVPQPDLEALLKKKNSVLCSLELRRPLGLFDVLGVSLQYELCASGVLNLLELAGIPLPAAERGAKHPLVIGGGPVSSNPEPLALFFDAFLIGEGEEAVLEMLEAVRRAKVEKLPRAQTLELLSGIDGVYVPSLFTERYDQSGRYLGTAAPAGRRVQRRILKTLEHAPLPPEPIRPNIKIVHERVGIEIMRGCLRGCRFCQAGYIYRPQRERSVTGITGAAREAIRRSGFEEISLLSLSSADYSQVLPLLKSLREAFKDDPGLNISLPSSRVDALTPELLAESLRLSSGSFTIAPEAGTQRLRNVINKGLSDEQIERTVQNAFAAGCKSLKLYFMLGLPTETDEDLKAIVDLARRLKRLGGRRNNITVSVSNFVPKPFTPFQWCAQITLPEILRRQNLIRDGLRKTGITFRWHRGFSSLLEGAFARGGRALGKVALSAYKLGCRLDGWDEHIKEDLWRRAFSENGLALEDCLAAKEPAEPLPWDHIDTGITKEFLLEERGKAEQALTTEDCREAQCTVCGVCGAGIKNEFLPLTAFPPPEDRSAPEFASRPASAPRLPAAAEAPARRYRLRYKKAGRAAFISHLDLSNFILRALRRAALPLAFTQGFNRHPKVSFGPPLQLGIESEFEYVDLFLVQELPPTGLAFVNEALPAGLEVLEAREIPLNARAIQDALCNQTFAARFEELPVINNSDWRTIPVRRTRGGTTTEAPLEKYVSEFRLLDRLLEFSIRSRCGEPSVKPSEVVQALCGNSSASSFKKIAATFAA